MVYIISKSSNGIASWLSVKIIFVLSSRRRHKRWNCDWSSDVCSSDLHERVHLQDPEAVDAAIPRTPSDGHLFESGLAQETLTEPFKTGGREGQQLGGNRLSVGDERMLSFGRGSDLLVSDLRVCLRRCLASRLAKLDRDRPIDFPSLRRRYLPERTRLLGQRPNPMARRIDVPALRQVKPRPMDLILKPRLDPAG